MPPHAKMLYLLQLFMYEALGLCKEGEGGRLIESGEWIKNKNGETDGYLFFVVVVVVFFGG